MSLFMRDALGRLVPVNPGLPARRGNQGGMGAILSEAELMARLPDADMAGAIGPGVVPGGEQSIGARRVKLEVEAAPPPALTYRPLGGAQQNNRGNSRIVTLDSDAGTPIQNIPSIVQTPLRNGDDAEVLAVSLGYELPDSANDPLNNQGLIPVRITAIIEWGIGGAFFTAECDWNQGITFAVTASFLRVSARVDAIPILGVGVIPLVLTAGIAYGNASTLNVSSPCRLTVDLGSLASGVTSAVTVVPPWAVGATIVDGGFLATGNDPDFTINFTPTNFLQAGTVYNVKSRANTANQIEGQFPIPIDGRFARVTNNGLLAANPVKIIYNLAF
jgi:hypothetical protein